MCDFRVSLTELVKNFGAPAAEVQALFDKVALKFGQFVVRDADTLRIPPEGRPLTRMIATMFDSYSMEKTGHSSAV